MPRVIKLKRTRYHLFCDDIMRIRRVISEGKKKDRRKKKESKKWTFGIEYKTRVSLSFKEETLKERTTLFAYVCVCGQASLKSFCHDL